MLGGTDLGARGGSLGGSAREGVPGTGPGCHVDRTPPPIDHAGAMKDPQNSEPPPPAASDATQANLSRRPPPPASAKGRRNVNALAQIQLLKATVIGGGFGGLLGLLLGGFLGHPYLGGLLGALGTGLGSLLFSGKVREPALVSVPAGSSTTTPRDYSRAETLAVRGHYDDAIAVTRKRSLKSPPTRSRTSRSRSC